MSPLPKQNKIKPLPDKILNQILKRAQSKENLTQEDIIELLGDAALTDEILTYVYEKLKENSSKIKVDIQALYGSHPLEKNSLSQSKQKRSKVNAPGIDIINSYLNEIGKRPLLSAEDEKDLANKVSMGNEAQVLLQDHERRLVATGKGMLSEKQVKQLKQAVELGKQARDELIERNLRLVVSIAKRYRSRGIPFLDLIQEGNLGLMRAVEKFDPSKGFRFSTYASWWIKQSIAKAILDQSKTIRIPMHLTEALGKMYKVKKQLTIELGREPKDEEIAQKMGIPIEKLFQLKQLQIDIVSLEQPLGDDGGFNLGDMIEDKQIESPLEITARAILHEAIQAALLELEPREQEIVKLRFGLEDGVIHTLENVAAKLGVTRERIRQIETKTLTKLRHPVLAMAVREIYDIKD
jgi:RNA polymerase primary sigma factor